MQIITNSKFNYRSKISIFDDFWGYFLCSIYHTICSNLIQKSHKKYLIFLIIALLTSCQKIEKKKDPKHILSQLCKKYKIYAIIPSTKTTISNIEKIKDACPNITINIDTNNNDNILAKQKDLQNAIYSKDHDIIWSIRGGHGAIRVLKALLNAKKPQKEKIFIGYSDSTILHLFFSQKWGWKTIHGPMLIEFFDPKKDNRNFEHIESLLNEKQYKLFSDLTPLNKSAKSLNHLSGELIGGNLSLIVSTIGTDLQIKTCQKILLLEDVWISGGAISRNLYHLKEAGLLNGVKAIILGTFSGYPKENIEFWIEDFAKYSSIPIFKTNEFGHGPINFSYKILSNFDMVKTYS